MDVMTITLLGTLLIVLSAGLHLWGAYKHVGSNNNYLFYIFKPTTTLLIAGLAYGIAPEVTPDSSNTYLYLILAGLLCSTFGDIFLMLPKDRFIPGLASFLVAHLIYIYAFQDFEFIFDPILIIPLIIAGITVLYILWPTLAEMKIPVIVYMAIIIAMAWLASERYLVLSDTASFYACIGALVFLFSDATLAIDRFKKQFSSAYAMIIISYYVAQYFIALSVG